MQNSPGRDKDGNNRDYTDEKKNKLKNRRMTQIIQEEKERKIIQDYLHKQEEEKQKLLDLEEDEKRM